jgi:colanic acid biosynthesis glycosyl transferase WcaI
METAGSGVANFRLVPLQPAERLGELLGLADIHLLPQSPEAEDLVLPSKLSGMLSSGRAIVATCRPNTEIAELVSQCGEIVPPEDAPALAAAIERLADERARRLELGRRARMIAEQTLGVDAVLSGIAAQMLTGRDATTSDRVPAPMS